MKIVVDNQIVKILAYDPTEWLKNPHLANRENHLSFGWPSLLEYIELGSLLTNLTLCDREQPLFQVCLSILCSHAEKKEVIDLYDQLFAENLTQIKNLPQINAPFLLQAIKTQREKAAFTAAEKILSPALAPYEKALMQQPSHIMHDLILYLAWDRMCVCLGSLFDYQSAEPQFTSGASVLKECLIESYQHITQQGRTLPGIYRLIEALLFYQMREENFQKHTPEEWAVLSQSFPVLKAPDQLADFLYIDQAVMHIEDLMKSEDHSMCCLTLDSPERVNARLSLAHCMMAKLKVEAPQWNYVLEQKQIICL